MKRFFALVLFLFPSLCFTQNVWTQKADFGGAARAYAVGFSIGSKGYIGTGEDGSGVLLKDFWEYNSNTNSWTQKADFGGTPRVKAVGFSIADKGYIGTGSDISGYTKDFWQYDTTNNSWTKRADFGSTARSGAVGFSIGTKGYLGTGSDGGTAPKAFWAYSPFSNAWAKKADFAGNVRYGAVSFASASKGYVGLGSSGTLLDFWEYDTLTDAWAARAGFQSGYNREFAPGFWIGTEGYMGTGFNLFNATNDFYQYDPVSDKWTQMTNYGGGAICYAAGFSIGNKGYIGTGVDNSSVYKKIFWEYSPPLSGINGYNKNSDLRLVISSGVVHLSGAPEGSTFELFDIQGKRMEVFLISSDEERLKIDARLTGLYVYRILHENKTISTGKLVLSEFNK